MNRRIALLPAILLLAACSTTTLYSSRFEAENSAGQQRQFVLYWNTTTSAFWGTTASPVTLLTQCSSRTVHYEEEPARGGQNPTEVVFRGEPGRDRAMNSNELPANGVCGRVLSADRLTGVTGPTIEFTVSCKPVSGNPFAATDDSYLQARDAPYVVAVTAMKTKDLQADTPKRPACGTSSP